MLRRLSWSELAAWIEPGFWAAPFLVAGDTSLATFGIPVRVPFSAAACLLAICAVGWWRTRAGRGRALHRGAGVLIVVLVLGVALLASLAYTTEIAVGADKAFRYWFFGVIGTALGVALMQSRETRRRLVLGFAVVGVVLALLGLGRLAVEGIDRQLAVLGGGPNVYVRVLFLGLLSSIVLAALAGGRGVTVLWGAAALLHLPPILFTGSRSGLIASLAALVLVALLALRRGRRNGVLAGLAVACLVAIAVFGLWLPSQFPELFGAASRYRDLVGELPGGMSVAARLAAARQGIEAFLARPWIGWGAGGFAAHSPLVYPHNLVLELLAELGVIGGLLLIAGAVMVLRALARAARCCAGPRALYTAWGAGLTAFAFVAAQFSGDLGDSRYLLFAAGATVGIAASSATAARAGGGG